ncbi:DUF998 domain-containing protein [Pseudonocardia sp. CA-107938]|uniref:DUF998 domain-containing protein n=1 Tax=Pseudonocardia sp. CA-107938 TaxID=3240021 RepID=UPI003D8B5BF1
MTRTLLACGMVAGPLFVIAFLVAGALRADYSPLRHPVSSLAIGDAGWTQAANFLVTGLLVLAFAVGLRRSGSGRWLPVLVGLVGIGLLGAGLFTCDPINGYPPGTPLAPVPTVRGTLHRAFSALVFLGLPIAALVAARGEHRRGFARYGLVSAVAFLALFVLAALGFAQQPVLLPVGGLLQRLCLVVGLAWLTVLAVDRARGAPTG